MYHDDGFTLPFIQVMIAESVQIKVLPFKGIEMFRDFHVTILLLISYVKPLSYLQKCQVTSTASAAV